MEPLTVAELIRELKKVNPKATVILSADEEGNGFNGVHAVDPCQANIDRWGGFEPCDAKYCPPDSTARECVILWP